MSKFAPIALAILLTACQKEDTAQPAPVPPPEPPYVCCPVSAPILDYPTDDQNIQAPITFRWSKVQGAYRYYIKADCVWSPNGSTVYATLINAIATDTTYTLTTLPTIPTGWNGATGQWKAQGIGSDGTLGPWSDARTFTVYQ